MHELSLRSQDYMRPAQISKPLSADGLVIEPAKCAEPLSEIIGRLRKLKHSKRFLDAIFSARDKQLYPRDLLVAYVPSRSKKGSGLRAVGLLRRSFKFDKDKCRTAIYVDFLWVMPECRGQHVGKRLLLAGISVGKEKDVRLVVAGSDSNKAACSLYESVGFRWDVTAPPKTEMLLEAGHVPTISSQQCCANLGRSKAAWSSDKLGSPTSVRLDCNADGNVCVRLVLAHGLRPAADQHENPAISSTHIARDRHMREERLSGCAAAA